MTTTIRASKIKLRSVRVTGMERLGVRTDWLAIVSVDGLTTDDWSDDGAIPIIIGVERGSGVDEGVDAGCGRSVACGSAT
jgi:hypothetical protein